MTKVFSITARLPMTVEARNAGATGRLHWWVFIGRVHAINKHAACARAKALGLVPCHATKTKAYNG
jgi:hypothetical protein